MCRRRQTLLRGDPDAALKSAPHRLSAEFSVGGQEHFYLEGQIAFALPGEDGDIVVHSSTQHPTEVQHICARLLGCDFNRVTAVVRRLGGGFGGKESNASWVAGAAALAANHTGKPVKLRLPREIDMIATGKRHPLPLSLHGGLRRRGPRAGARCGAGGRCRLEPRPHAGRGRRARSPIPTTPTGSRISAPSATPASTNKQSNTAFRGFGGPQGVVVMEDALDRIAHQLGRDADEVRALNFYNDGRRRDAVRPEGRGEPPAARAGPR